MEHHSATAYGETDMRYCTGKNCVYIQAVLLLTSGVILDPVVHVNMVFPCSFPCGFIPELQLSYVCVTVEAQCCNVLHMALPTSSVSI